MRKYTKLLRQYYHLDKGSSIKSLFWDVILTPLGIGSGLITSFFRGMFFSFVLDYGNPTLLGRGFRIVNPYFFNAGNYLWIKDGVSFGLGGKLTLGDRCVFCERATVWSGKKGVSIGNDFAMGIGSYLCGSGAQIKIGNEVRIADSVRVYTFNHIYENGGIPISRQGNVTGEVTIKDNVWIGSGAVVLAGVTINKNSVVAAGAVVTTNVQANTLVAGIPAKVIKKIL